jgi:hypothetical protein
LADAAIEFIKIDDASPQELERLERLNVLIKEKHIPISNLDMHKPTQVVAKVQARIPFRFTLNNHQAAWRHFKIRPSGGAQKPEATDARYCVYDALHRDYLYTEAWIDKLVRDLADPADFLQITTRAATPK